MSSVSNQTIALIGKIQWSLRKSIKTAIICKSERSFSTL